MATRALYAPLPSINTQFLLNGLLEQYQSHAQTPELLQNLVIEYLKLWRLAQTFRNKRIVAPAPVIAVQQVHWSDMDRYRYDCIVYFNRFVREELFWLGRLDIEGAVDTVHAYKQLYDKMPPPIWQDLIVIYELRLSKFEVVK